MGADRNPNIVLILADDCGYGDLSCLNPQSKVRTPCLDRLAAEGRTFTDAHSSSAVCSPTRYSVLTGRYNWRSRLQRYVLHGWSPLLVEKDRPTIASLLKQAGYHTACIGKWHVGLDWHKPDGGQLPFNGHKDPGVDYTRPIEAGPHTIGFDESYIIAASLDMPPYCYIENGKVTELPTGHTERSERPAMWRDGPMAPSFSHENCLHTFTQKAVAFIDDHARQQPAQPFFLYMPLPSPHTPHTPRKPFQGQSDAGPYGDLVVETDWSVGQVMEAVERSGAGDNTLFIYTSDNGAHMRGTGFDFEQEFGHRSNYVFRGQKSDAWDGGHRVPFIARLPGRIAAGSRYDHTVCLTDFMGTFAAMTGQDLTENAGEDSYDISPALFGQTEDPLREATVHHSIQGEFAIRRGRWKLIDTSGSGGWSMATAGSEDPPRQLYDVDADPSETRNLYWDKPAIAAELLDILESYRRRPRSVPAQAPARNAGAKCC